jgi:hypothetical protein
MAWQDLGSITVGPMTTSVLVGPVNLPPFGGIVVRVRQIGGPSPWPFSYGLLWVSNSNGRELGTIKVYGHTEGESYRLGDRLPSLLGGGLLYFAPRLYNTRWLRSSGTTWTLAFQYDSPSTELPQDRVQSPGFQSDSGRLLPLVSVGSLGRLRF